MSTLIIAERKRRQWHKWASERLASYTSFSAEEEASRAKGLRRWKEQYGPARCYDVSGYALGDAIEATAAVVQGLNCKRLYVLAGDEEAPVLFGIDLADLRAVLERTQDSVVRLVAEGGDAALVVSLPALAQEEETEILFCAEGSWERAIDIVTDLLPGGHEFRGN
jgi:hypothetical protein